MAENRGVFRLRTLRTENIQGDGVAVTDVWVPHVPTSLTNYGYFSSGYNGSSPGITSRTDRTTFTTDTTVNLPSSPIPVGQKDGATLTSLTHMYAAGGWDAQTRVYKMNYASETWVNAPGHPAMIREQRQTGNNAVGPKTAGYIFMGDDPNYPGPQHSTVQKILYSVDTWSQLPNYPYSSIYSMGAGNQTRGIISGGNKSNGDSKTSQSYKFTFSDETYASVPGMSANASGPGNGERSESAAAGNDEYLWISGGRMPHGMTTSSIKYTYSTDSWERTPGISRSRRYLQAAGNTTQGYWAGGDSPSPAYSTVDKISYATDTATAAPGANLTEARSKQFATSPRMNGLESPTTPGVAPYRWKDGFQADDLKAGYYQGGGNPSSNSATQKVSYISDQVSLVPGGSLPQNGSSFAGVNSNSTKTIISGGEPGGESFMKFVYTTETSSNLAGSMPSRRTLNNDMGYGTESVGYVTGGMSEPSSPGFYHSGTQKIEYATDTTSDVPGANAHQPMREIGAFGNVDHTLGYIVGGIEKSPTTDHSRIQKMTYSTETIANIPANMQNSYFNLGTTTGPDAGYIYSKQEYPGYTANGAIEKFEYATDSRTTVPQPSYYPSYGANGTGNSTNGYYGGGGPSRYTRILKLNFSTGVSQDLPSSQFTIPSGVYRSAASSAVARKKSPKGAPVPTPTADQFYSYSAAARGYYTGGPAPGAPSGNYVSNSERLDFSSDTFTVLPGMTVQNVSGSPYTLFRGASSTSSTNGYLLGGSGGGGSYYYSSIWKSTYASETTAKIPSNLSGTRYMHVAAGTTNKGYALGGNRPGIQSNVDKITYSNDSVSNIGNMPSGNRQRGGAASSPTALYASQSYYRTNFEKVTFASDTIAPIPSVNTPNPGASPSNYYGYGQIAGTGSQTQGYFGGGVWATPGSANSLLWKMTYSTDTLSSAPNLTGSKNYVRNTGDNDKGYFIGGSNPGPVATTTKFPFSTETFSTIPGTLQYPKSAGQGYGPRDQGVHEIGTPNVV